MRSIFRLLFSIFLFMIIGYINELFSINRFQHDFIYDIGLRFLPQFNNIIANIIFGTFLVTFLIRWAISNLRVILQFFSLLNIVFFLRVIAFNLTLLPPIIKECNNVIPNRPIKWLFFYEETCTDYIFSGHVSFSVLMSLFTYYYSDYLIEKIVYILFALFEMVIVVATRTHYSVDSYLACVICILIFHNFILNG